MPTTSDRILALTTVTALLLTAGCAAPRDSGAGSPTPAPVDDTSPQQPSGDRPSGDPHSDGTRASADGAAPDFTDLSVVTTGLSTPWSIAFHGESALVSERDSGRVLEIDTTGSTASGDTREVTTVPGVAARGEGGLLGLAVHPNDSENDSETTYLYAYLTTTDDNRVLRFPLTGGAGGLGVGEPETVVDGIPAAGNHNCGRIGFGPDDMLYVTTGDAGDTGTAQDPDSLAGKILRLAPDGGIPDDNPSAGSAAYSMGHRNPQGLDWADDGTLYASEFGQDTWDELNVIEPGGNYGWPEVEGIARDSDQTGDDRSGDDAFIDPVQQWEPADASPSGLAVTGDSIIVAALRGERLWEVPLDELGQSTDHLTGEHGRLRDVAEAPDGSLWILTHNTDGRGDPSADDDRILRVPVG